MRIDVFCRVVDNYGDAGVTWRLARQLAVEHAMQATLWIDAPQALAQLVPGLDPALEDTLYERVRVRRLGDDVTSTAPLPDIVVEGFGCGLPPSYLHAMASARTQPVWINLEYLSAEPWIESVHGLPSPHPQLPLTRYFFFPGFTRATGGLLRERDVLARRDRAQSAARTDPRLRFPPAIHSLLDGMGATDAARPPLVVSLFCYANGALAALLDAWVEGEEPVLCLVPEGTATASFDAWLGGGVPHAGQCIMRGALTLAIVPFLGQDAYDALLSGCDLDFVRGEDSFVRAQWAARPFVWHIYPQSDEAHRVKLEAFLDRYLAEVEEPSAAATRRFWRAWNGTEPGGAAAAWSDLRAALPALARHNARWCAQLAARRDLATALLDFCRDRL